MQTLFKSIHEVMDLFRTLIMVMVSQVYVYIQTHQEVYIKYMWYFIYQLFFNKNNLCTYI